MQTPFNERYKGCCCSLCFVNSSAQWPFQYPCPVGTTTYTVDSDSGKIKEHSEVWRAWGPCLIALLGIDFEHFGCMCLG